MNLTGSVLRACQKWHTDFQRVSGVRGKAGEHYMAYSRFLNDKHIIYGMDDPQKTYLALTRFYVAFLGRLGRLAGRFNSTLGQAQLRDGIAAAKRNRKDTSPLVSNYVLHLDRSDFTVGDDQSVQVNRAERTETGAASAEREMARRGFTDRYTASAFRLRGTAEERRLGGAQKNRPGLESLSAGDYSRDQYVSDMRSFAVRRACKFLMYDSIASGKTVVYCLDDLNLTAVADMLWLVTERNSGDIAFATRADAKAQIEASPGTRFFTKVPVCTTEIREIFRCWDYFKVPLKSGMPKIIFMRNFQQVRPPWETENLKSWAELGVEQAKENFPKLPAAVRLSRQVLYDAALSCAASGDYAKSIRNFHALGIGSFKRQWKDLPQEA